MIYFIDDILKYKLAYNSSLKRKNMIQDNFSYKKNYNIYYNPFIFNEAFPIVKESFLRYENYLVKIGMKFNSIRNDKKYKFNSFDEDLV